MVGSAGLVTAPPPRSPSPWPDGRPRIAVVVPCYGVRDQVLGVIGRVGPEVSRIYCVDDACPEGTGRMLERETADPRVRVIFHQRNQGVGGATITGIKAALSDGATVVVKVDGDGQMDPALIERIVHPILAGQADYTKGNRFFRLTDVRGMPLVRLAGNAVLSFVSKLSSGYWNVFDPTNGFIAVQARVAELLPLDRVMRGYFFESDLLYHLYALRAAVADVPMTPAYGSGRSHLRIHRVVFPFFARHALNLMRRVAYTYFLRDFSIASIELVLGAALLAFGGAFGWAAWSRSMVSGTPATAGTVMLAALPVIVGVQLLLGFLNYDIQQTPRIPIHPSLER